MRRAVVLAAIALCGLLPTTAWASSISPPAGATVAAAPAQVRVVVPAPLEASLARARVNGPRGAVASSARVAAADPQAMRISVSADGPGTYRVAWWGMTTDGHPVSGTSSFAVRRAVPAAAPAQPEGRDGIGVVGIIARWLVLVGVLGTAGLAFTREFVMARAWDSGGIAPPGADHADRVRADALAASPRPVAWWWVSWWALVVAWAVGLAIALPAQALAIGGDWWVLVSDTRWGVAWIGLVALVVIAGVAAAAMRRGIPGLAPSGARMYALAVPGALGAVLLSWSGHASSGTDATLGVAFDIAHGWATAVWLGGLLMLGVLALPLLAELQPVDRVRLGAAVIVRFSAVAIAAVVVLVVTGIYRALAELPSLSALWETSYGLALLAKLIVFAAMLALAAWNRMVLHPRLERAALGLEPAGEGAALPALRASVRAELALGAAVMAAVAVLVALMPPT